MSAAHTTDGLLIQKLDDLTFVVSASEHNYMVNRMEVKNKKLAQRVVELEGAFRDYMNAENQHTEAMLVLMDESKTEGEKHDAMRRANTGLHNAKQRARALLTPTAPDRMEGGA